MFWRWKVPSQHWIALSLLVPRGKKTPCSLALTEHLVCFFLPTDLLQSVCYWCSLGFVGAAREDPGQFLVRGASEFSEAQVFGAGDGVWPVLRQSPCCAEQSSQQLRPLSRDKSCLYLGEHSGLTTELWVLWAHEVMRIILELSRESSLGGGSCQEVKNWHAESLCICVIMSSNSCALLLVKPYIWKGFFLVYQFWRDSSARSLWKMFTDNWNCSLEKKNPVSSFLPDSWLNLELPFASAKLFCSWLAFWAPSGVVKARWHNSEPAHCIPRLDCLPEKNSEWQNIPN